VYGNPETLPILESTPLVPINPYGESKVFIERVLDAYQRAHGLHYVALRYFNAGGAHVDGNIGEFHIPETHVIPLAIRSALGTGPRLQVFGADLPSPDGTCIRDFVHVSDLAHAHGLALKYLVKGRNLAFSESQYGRGYLHSRTA
jgi:UDP-glucose 4-epimerase